MMMMRPISITLSSILNMSSMGWIGEMLEYRASSTSDVWFTIRTCLKTTLLGMIAIWVKTSEIMASNDQPIEICVKKSNLSLGDKSPNSVHELI